MGLVAFWDTKLFKSLKDLLIRPGSLSLAYVQGKKGFYTKPVSLFFIANLIYFLFQPVDTINSNYVTQTEYQAYSSWTKKMAERKMAINEIELEDLKAEYNAKSTSNSRLFLILMVVLFSIFVALVFL